MADESPTSTVTQGPAEQDLPKPKYRLFTECPQDWFIAVVRGGDLYKIIHSVDGWYVDDKLEFRKENTKHKNIVTPLRAATGFQFVGVPGFQGMKVTKFAWNSFWREDDNSPNYIVTAHKPELVYIYPFESQYPLTFQGIDTIAQDRTAEEDESFVAVTFVITVRVRMLRPRVALMTNTDWFGGVLVPKMQGALKDFAGDKNYDELIRGARKKVSNDLFAYIAGNDSPFRKNILERAGIDIIDFSLVDIKPNPAYEEAQNRLAEKQKAAKGIIATAEAEKQARKLAGEGEEAYEAAIGRGRAAGIKAVKEAAGSDAGDYLKWTQIQKTQLTTYVEAGAHASIIVGPNGKPVTP